MSSAPNTSGLTNSDSSGANIDYRATSTDMSAQKQTSMNEKHIGGYSNVVSDEMTNSSAFTSQGQPMGGSDAQQSVNISSGSNGGDLMQGGMLRNQMNPNAGLGGYQMSYQAVPLQGLSSGMNGGMSITSQGPLLSSGNYNNMKHMNPHSLTSTDSFMPIQPQGMMQYMPSGGQAMGVTGLPTGAAQSMQHGQIQQGHGSISHNNAMMGRQNIMPGHSSQGHMPMGGMGQDVHGGMQGMQGGMTQQNMAQGGMSGMGQDMSQQQYMQMGQRGVSMPMHQMNAQQMAPHMVQNQPNGMNMHYNMGQPPNQGQYIGQPGMSVHPQQQPPQPQTAQSVGMMSSGNHGHQSTISGRQLVPKPWHSAELHASAKDNMVEEIVKLLKSRRPNATEDWHGKLPQMAKRLEEALYHDASSFEEYNDNNTLKQRLQQLAMSMGTKNPAKPAAAPAQPAPQNLQQHPGAPMNNMQQIRSQGIQQPLQGQGQPPHMQIQYGQQAPPQHMQPPHMQSHMQPHALGHQQVMNQPMNSNQQYQQQQYGRPTGPGQYAMQPGMNMPNGGYHNNNMAYPQHNMSMQQGQAMMQYPMQNGEQPGNDYLRTYNNGQPHMMVGSNGQQPTGQQMMPGSGYMGEDGSMQQYGMMKRVVPNNAAQGNMPVPPGHAMPGNAPQAVMPPGQMAMMPQHVAPPPQGMNATGMPPQGMQPPSIPMGQPMNGGQSMPAANADEHRKQVLKQQQQRLLLLRHASKCPHEDSKCPVTPHCWSMKQLWKHIMSCKDQDCKVAHCVSSRYVLSHYSKCKEGSCPVCQPVREAIKRNYERSKDVVNTARNQNSLVPQRPPEGAVEMNGQFQTNNQNVSGQVHHLPDKQAPPAKKARKDSGKKSEPPPPVAPQQPTTLVIPVREKQKVIYPVDPISSAIYSFTNEQIQAHFRTIHEGLKLTVAKVREVCKPVIEELYKIPHAHGVFGAPVDPVALGLPDYLEIVKVPMDLGTIMKRLDQGSYRDFHNFINDVHLTFDNAMLYNPKNSDVYALAKNLKKEFDSKIKSKISEFERGIEERRKFPDYCGICGEMSLQYEPPNYYCNGTCGQRIRRNAVFYSNPTNNYHWCGSCYNNIREGETMRFPDSVFTKADLQKKKHTDDHDEAWVLCEVCQRWVHQICSLFNARRNVGDEVSFVCPRCLQQERRTHPDQIIVAPTAKKMKAVDLPVTTLSDFIEKRILKRLQMAYEEMAEKLNVSTDAVEKCPTLTLRQVSCLDKIQQVREGVYNRYKDKNYPADFPCRTKCLILFQNIDGQDVLLFGMYVYEYGHKCPQPNQRRVYISYLDSVHYLRPKQYRTLVYHEILISYLDYVKARGFHTAHIWACPPQKGDDYILYVHPADQKTPRPQILRLWYDEMLKRCMERGIVVEVTDLHSEFLTDSSNDATVLPYFEGDYWVNEAEVIIKNLNEGKHMGEDHIDDNAGVKSKRKMKSKKATRDQSKALTAVGRDPVMAKLASIIEPMKDTFFVARLHPKEYADRCAAQRMKELAAERGEESEEKKSEKALQEEALLGQDVVSNMPDIKAEEEKQQAQAQVQSSSAGEASAAETGSEAAGTTATAPEEEDGDDFSRAAAAINNNTIVAPAEDDNNSMASNGDMEVGQTATDEVSQTGEAAGESAPVIVVPSEAPMDTSGTEDDNDRRVHTPREPHKSIEAAEALEQTAPDNSMAESKESEAVMEVSDATSEPATVPAADASSSSNAVVSVAAPTAAPASGHAPVFVSKAIIPCGEGLPSCLTDDTEDVDDIQECEHLDTRQSFLNLCQGNHYQFDQLRRAKHSSMMVLYHLHNPDAPKFLPTCTSCQTEIISGLRFHCDRCEIDFCQKCVSLHGPTIHQHSLRSIAASSNVVQQLTEEQRRERQRSVQLHMQLLNHASICVKCDSKNCARMKEFMQHEAACTIKAKGGCRLCARVSNLLSIHARQCRVENCRVPHCLALREQFRQLALRQQQMDDRRRKQMNIEYGRGGATAAAADNDD